jgi:hypothetical protein
VSVQYITAVLAQFDVNIAAIANEVANPNGGGFKASAYRIGADKEPDSAAEGLYYLDMANTLPKERYWGTGENIWTGKLTVQLCYYRGGGDAGGVDGGDRRSVAARANDDCMRLSDVCENPANYNRDTTGIRWIRYTGHRRAYDLKNYEVWEVGFDVEWRSDQTLTNSSTSTTTGSGVICDGISTGTIQLSTLDVVAGGYASGTEAFVLSVRGEFILDRASTLTPDAISIVAAYPPGYGNWLRDA